MTLRVPTAKVANCRHAQAVGAGAGQAGAGNPERPGPHQGGPCGSRRAQEYEAKINSEIGHRLRSLIEVVARPVPLPTRSPKQSYSERQLY